MISVPDTSTHPVNRRRPLPHIALLCLHTSPFVQPGHGDAGGMNVYVRHLATALAAHGHRVDVVTLWRDGEHPGEPAPVPPVSVQEVAPRLRLVTVALDSTVHADKTDLAAHLDEVVELLNHAYPDSGFEPSGLEPPDLVHGHYWLSCAVGLGLARAWEIPLVCTFHTTGRAKNLRAGASEQPEPESRTDGEQRVIAATNAVVVNTAAEASGLVEHYDAERGRIHVIPPGVDTSVFHPASTADPECPRPVQDGDGPFVIGFAGRLQALKGPQILVETLALLRDRPEAPQFRLWIAGTGPEEFTAALDEQIRRHGLTDRIERTGSIGTAELAERFRASHVVAVPSSSETFGLVALEAQACGTPVVATDVDGLAVAVEDGQTGWLLPDRAPTTWAAAFASIAADPSERARRAERAASRAAEFSWDETASAHTALYERLLTHRPAGPDPTHRPRTDP